MRLKPGLAEAHNNLGAVYRRLRRFPESIACYREALRINPQYAEAHFNLGIVAAEVGDLDQAVASCREALKLRPHYTEAHFQLAQALRAKGEIDAATAEYQETIRLEPQTPDAHLSRALAWLLAGNFTDGWAEYPWRWKCKRLHRPALSVTPWDGSAAGVAAGANSVAPLSPGGHAGRTILLHCEQGLGDTLQFIRYAPLVKKRAGTLIVACQKPLVKLLAACPGIDRLVDAGASAAAARRPPADARPAANLRHHAGDDSRGGALCLRRSRIDREVAKRASRPRRLQDRHRLAGQPAVPRRPGPLHPAELLRVAGRVCPACRFFSLQKGPGVEQLQDLAGRFPHHGSGQSAWTTSWTRPPC